MQTAIDTSWGIGANRGTRTLVSGTPHSPSSFVYALLCSWLASHGWLSRGYLITSRNAAFVECVSSSQMTIARSISG